jgi:hypothetical protein
MQVKITTLAPLSAAQPVLYLFIATAELGILITAQHIFWKTEQS